MVSSTQLIELENIVDLKFRQLTFRLLGTLILMTLDVVSECKGANVNVKFA